MVNPLKSTTAALLLAVLAGCDRPEAHQAMEPGGTAKPVATATAGPDSHCGWGSEHIVDPLGREQTLALWMCRSSNGQFEAMR